MVTSTPSTDASEGRRTLVVNRALALGFDAVGFTAPETGTAGHDLAEFLARGYQGDMGWLERTQERRSSPTGLWPEARSIVAVGMNYGPRVDPLEAVGNSDQGAISVYARGRDYHKVMKKSLRALARWISETLDCEVKLFVDTAPVMEKPVAQQAGLGWQGKHTNLVSTEFGSWLFLGEIFTTLDLKPDVAGQDHCGSCQRCLDACPTSAFTAPYRLDARRCISYLTIEHKGHIALEFREPMGNRIYGCDDCLAVCPWNKFAHPTVHSEYLEDICGGKTLKDLATLDDKGFRSMFSGSPIKRLGRDRFVRNVLIAIGNSGNSLMLDVATRLISDPSPLVRAMAVWAVSKLAAPAEFASYSEHYRTSEGDPDVLLEWDRSLQAARGTLSG